MPTDDRLTDLREQIFWLLFDRRDDDTMVERPVEADSRLAREVERTSHDVARHFLGQLNQHCAALAMAIADALDALAKLDPNLPFSATVVTRALFEAAGDLYWLGDNQIDHVERARRTFLVFLKQREAQVRNLEHVAEYDRQQSVERTDRSKAITDGWELLKREAEQMAAAGYELRTSKRAGSKYSLGEPKPSISTLVDEVLSAYLGRTRVPLYALYSSIAHADGEGLSSLLGIEDTVETSEGTRYRHGFRADQWEHRIVSPATYVGRGAVRTWALLAHPERVLREGGG